MIDRWIVDSEPSTRYPIFTRGNVGEVFPDPVAPLTRRPHHVVRRARLARRLDALRCVRPRRVRRRTTTRSSASSAATATSTCRSRGSSASVRPASPPSRSTTSCGASMPGVPPYAPQPTDESPAHTERISADAGVGADRRVAARAADGRATCSTSYATTRPDLDAAERHAARGSRPRADRRALPSICSGSTSSRRTARPSPSASSSRCARRSGRSGDMLKLMAGVGDVESAAPSYAMWKLSRLDPASDEFKIGFAEFLNDYGARARTSGRFGRRRGRPIPTWRWSRSTRCAAARIPRRRSATRRPARTSANRSAPRSPRLLEGDSENHGQFVAALRAATIFLAGRERSKTNAIRLVHEMRLAMHELGRRYVERGIFDAPNNYGMVRWDELDQLVADPGIAHGRPA